MTHSTDETYFSLLACTDKILNIHKNNEFFKNYKKNNVL